MDMHITDVWKGLKAVLRMFGFTSPVKVEQHINLRQEMDQISATEMKSRISTALLSSHCVHVVFKSFSEKT